MTSYRVTSDVSDPWEGPLDELLDANRDLPDLVRRRIATLPVGDRVRFGFADEFTVERIS